MAAATVRDRVIERPSAVARALRPLLGAHPVPQRDPRARGLLVEVAGDGDDRDRLALSYPALAPLLALLPRAPAHLHVLAVNETPPTDPDLFWLRPHVDRRWLGGAFGAEPPRRTTVVFLAFPKGGDGGELAVFPAGAFASGPPPRERARAAVAAAKGVLYRPAPGRAVTFDGGLPHAVLGHRAPDGAPFRLAAVLAEVRLGPGDPPPRRHGLLAAELTSSSGRGCRRCP